MFGLGVASGRVQGVEIDTAFFDGNHAPEVSVQGCCLTSPDADEVVRDVGFTGWETIMPRVECGPSRVQAWRLDPPTQGTRKAYTHIRLQMWPDGGIARFRLWGTVVPVLPSLSSSDPNSTSSPEIDLAAAVNGALCISVSDQHFGKGSNLTLPGRGVDMGDGWETKRSRGVHVDWAVIRLSGSGVIERVVVDTAHFRGNFPQKVQIYAALGRESGLDVSADDHEAWTQILVPTPTGPDREHEYGLDMLDHVRGTRYSHVKLVIIPDGGVKRLRVFGRPVMG